MASMALFNVAICAGTPNYEDASWTIHVLICFSVYLRSRTILVSMDNNTTVDTSVNRRDFFKRAAVLGVAVAGAGALLAGCKHPDASARHPGTPALGDGATPPGGGGAGAGEFSCMSTEGMDPTHIAVRESLKYIDETPKADQDCANCLYFKPDANGGCGGCTVIPGPVHPRGWSITWVAQR